jgi:hypothetical protein
VLIDLTESQMTWAAGSITHSMTCFSVRTGAAEAAAGGGGGCVGLQPNENSKATQMKNANARIALL